MKRLKNEVAAVAALAVAATMLLGAVTTVPNVTGRTPSRAVNMLEDRGLQVGQVSVIERPGSAPGRVVETRPRHNRLALKNSHVDLIVQSGRPDPDDKPN